MKKTKLKWTKKLPTVDGFYWWRWSAGGCSYRIIIEDGRVAGSWDGQWYGPIPSKEPTEGKKKRPRAVKP